SALTQKCYIEKIGVADFEIVTYVADLLVNFLHIDDVYWIRDARGKRIYEVGEMLLEASRAKSFPGMKWEREIRKHIGDYTLFMVGLFPESLSRRTVVDLDYFIDYVRAGRESYRIVAEFDQGAYRSLAPLYRKLSQHFEICTLGLNFVKKELEALQDPAYRQMRGLIFE
ncbi:MAG: hypothetical protein JSV16_15265, partial [Candidatus Hydrogenedentota bacterium]